MTFLHEAFAYPFSEDLSELGARRVDDYRTAVPYPNASFDGLVCNELLEAVLEEFPRPQEAGWRSLPGGGKAKNKLVTDNAEASLGPHTKHLINRLCSSDFLVFLEQLTEIRGLVADPHLTSAGLHQILSGGFLEVHADYHWNARMRMFRRVNLILFLNKEWPEEYNGHLELWDTDMICRQAFLPTWNRLVITTLGPRHFHGFPTPIRCREDETRKSLTIWYFTSYLPKTLLEDYKHHEPAWIERDEHGTPKGLIVHPERK